MNSQRFQESGQKFGQKSCLWRSSIVLAAVTLTSALAAVGQQGHNLLVLTSTNSATANAVEVFSLETGSAPSLTLSKTLPTGGKGGAAGNAGILQFADGLGAVANFGSNTVTQLVRDRNAIALGTTIPLASGCLSPDSVALRHDHLFVVGANCAESFSWPYVHSDGKIVELPTGDTSSAQIAVGETWAAVTMKSGSVLQLPLTDEKVLSGTTTTITLPAAANNTPLGEAFWGNTLGFTPAHSPDSFALVSDAGIVSPIVGPAPAYPTNAPCWVAKGPNSVWYTSNSPGKAISEFFTDNQGGILYKSVALVGSPTDITVSADKHWLAVIFTNNSEAYVEVFSIDGHGDLTPVATSSSISVASFNGVAISE